MLTVHNITIKNFLSVGSITQTIKFDESGFVLIIGENLDQGGNGARNGVGKSTIIQALSYAWFDTTITPIKKDNMVNMINKKNMLVTVEYTINGDFYKIERGRKPAVLRVFKNGEEDSAQGENRSTQPVIEKTLGMSHDMFKNIMALSTYNQPFLLMKAADQRSMIEELMGITLLSEKASILKKDLDASKAEIKAEEVRIDTQVRSNEAVAKSVDRLKRQSTNFIDSQAAAIVEFDAAITGLSGIDVDVEIENHKKNTAHQTSKKDKQTLSRSMSQLQSQITDIERRISKLGIDLDRAEKAICPTCRQPMADHTKIKDGISSDIVALSLRIDPLITQLNEQTVAHDALDVSEDGDETFYKDIDSAYKHKQNLDALVFQLTEEGKKTDPYIGQIDTLEKDAIVDIDYAALSHIRTTLSHQEFLHKLLTHKDSFIRKKIIDQNISYLNGRIQHYVTALGLSHSVIFKNDLSVEIVLLGQQFDFGQLSRGQQNRLVLAFSWAFRDVWESNGHPSNLLFIDEMLDSGLDTIGAENTLTILKKMARERKKDVFLISHKEELLTRVDNVMTVTLENGFTSYDE